MLDPDRLEESYQRYITNLTDFVPDGVFDVDLSLLHELGLLEEGELITEEDDTLTHSFYVVESPEKLTLFNNKFVVWIVPRLQEQSPSTYTLIALNENEKPHLEMVFTTSGVYNHSGLVLRILEKFLEQIEENESEICKFKGRQPNE